MSADKQHESNQHCINSSIVDVVVNKFVGCVCRVMGDLDLVADLVVLLEISALN